MLVVISVVESLPPTSSVLCKVIHTDFNTIFNTQTKSQQICLSQMLNWSCGLLITHMYHTFFVLLKNWGRGCSHLHSQTVGPPEGVAVPHNKAARLLVFQDWNSWRERNNESSSRIFLTKKVFTFGTYLDPLRCLACTRILMCPAQILQ